MMRCQTVLLEDLTRPAHPWPSPSRLDWGIRDETDTSSRELDDNSGNIPRVLKRSWESESNEKRLRRYIRRYRCVAFPQMVRVQGIVVDAQYSGTCDAGKWAKEPEDEVSFESRHSRETHLRRMGSNERRQRAHKLTYINDVPPNPRRHGNLYQ